MRAVWLGSMACAFAATPILAQEPLSGAFQQHRLTGDALAQRGNPVALVPQGQVPNLLSPPVPGQGFAAWTLRGLGNSAAPAPLAPAIGLFLDGVPLGEADAESFALFDVQSVSVAAGGWGLSGSGGSVDIALVEPDPSRFSGWVGGGWGAYDRKMARGGVNVPLGALTLNAAAYVSDDDGVARNLVTDEKLNDADRAGLRLAARLDPVDRLSLTVALAYVEDKSENLLSFRCSPVDPADCGGRSLTTGLTEARILGGVPQFAVPVAGEKAGQRLGSLRSTTLLTAKLAWVGEAVQVELLSALRDSSEAGGLDYADGRGLPGPALPQPPVRGFADGGFTLLTDRAVRQASHAIEVKGLLPWGGFSLAGRYLDTSDRLDMADLLTAENGTATGNQQLLADRVARTDGRILSAEAFTYATLGPVFVRAGLGYIDEEQSLGLSEAACGPAGCLSPFIGSSVPQRQSWNVWTPTVAADLRIGQGVKLFAGARRGYRSGGWNLRAVTAPALSAFAPETAWTYEGGATALLFADRLEARLTAYAIDASDRQASGAALIGGVPQAIIAQSDWRNRGVELALTARPVDGLVLRLQLGTQDAQWRASDAVRAQQALCAGGTGPANACGSGIVRSNGTLASPTHAPDVSVGFGGSWDIAVPMSGVVLTPKADLLWANGHETDLANLVPGPGSPLLVDAGIAMRTDDETWLLTFACRNCLDAGSTEASLLGWAYPLPPRSWMLIARRRF